MTNEYLYNPWSKFILFFAIFNEIFNVPVSFQLNNLKMITVSSGKLFSIFLLAGPSQDVYLLPHIP